MNDLTALGLVGLVYAVNAISVLVACGGWAVWYFLIRRKR